MILYKCYFLYGYAHALYSVQYWSQPVQYLDKQIGKSIYIYRAWWNSAKNVLWSNICVWKEQIDCTKFASLSRTRGDGSKRLKLESVGNLYSLTFLRGAVVSWIQRRVGSPWDLSGEPALGLVGPVYNSKAEFIDWRDR